MDGTPDPETVANEYIALLSGMVPPAPEVDAAEKLSVGSQAGAVATARRIWKRQLRPRRRRWCLCRKELLSSDKLHSAAEHQLWCHRV